MRICLDMDGVLCDFVGGAAKALGFDAKLVRRHGFYEDVGHTPESFWRGIEALGVDFWRKLDAYPWANWLMAQCERLAGGWDNLIILSSPSLCPNSASGKVLWLQDRLGRDFRSYLLGSRKEFCARPDTVLIDDTEHVCQAFVQAGGHALLFPRPWNAANKDEWPWTVREFSGLDVFRRAREGESPVGAVKPTSDGTTRHVTGAVRSSDCDGVRWDLLSWPAIKSIREFAQTHQQRGLPALWCVTAQLHRVANGDWQQNLLEVAAVELLGLMELEAVGEANYKPPTPDAPLPYHGLERVAATCAEGARKYGDHNWLKGFSASDLLNHAIRHCYLWQAGDRSEDHLAHACWNVFGAIHSRDRWPQLNVRVLGLGYRVPVPAPLEAVP